MIDLESLDFTRHPEVTVKVRHRGLFKQGVGTMVETLVLYGSPQGWAETHYVSRIDGVVSQDHYTRVRPVPLDQARATQLLREWLKVAHAVEVSYALTPEEAQARGETVIKYPDAPAPQEMGEDEFYGF